MEILVTAGSASSPAAHLPTPAGPPKTNTDHPENHDLSGPIRSLEKSNHSTSANMQQDTASFTIDLTACTQGMDEESLFVAKETMAEDDESSEIHEIKADDMSDDLPTLRDFLDPEVVNLVTLSRHEELGRNEVDEDEDLDSDYKDNSGLSDDESDIELLNPEVSSISDQAGKRPRQKPASNVREYIARLHAKEDREFAKKTQREENKKPGAKPSRKRKTTECDAESYKALKTANGHRLLPLNDSPSSSHDYPPLPVIEPIKAATHAAQFAQIIAGIPKNCDTRREDTQKRDLMEAVRIFGSRKVEAINGDWKLKGMETPMRSHQITAVAWMMKRELARTEPFGGILADAMGMGKTVMSLACMVGNPPNDEDIEKFCNATLVVVPNKVVAQQWDSETRRHCMAPNKHMVVTYDRQREDIRQVCRENFIVLVTYKELINQYPDGTVLRKLRQKYDTDDISFKRALDKIIGPLFRINWYRIILDEAHAIRNADSRTSKACCELFGKYRWALSGTPLANSSQEMYPYMRFLNCDWTMNLKEFRSMFFVGGQPNSQFAALTSLMMYRRIVNDEFLGRQIISLPERKEVDLWVSISKEEQAIVDAVSKYYKLQKKLKELSLVGLELDEVEPKKQQGETMSGKDLQSEKRLIRGVAWILGRASQVRQRQTISHVYCVERLLRGRFVVEELIELREALEQIGAKKTILEQIQIGVDEDTDILKYKKGLQMIQEREENFFGKYFDMIPLLDILVEQASMKGIICPLCKEAPVEPVFSHLCPHVYCSKCLCAALLKDVKRRTNTVMCLYEGCDKHLGVGNNLKTIEKIMEEAREDGSSYREPGKDSMNVAVHQVDDRNGFFIASTFLDEIPVLPSTKLTAAMAVVLTWLDEAPNDKILIFTQFTGSAKMLGFMLQTLNIGFRYYYGGLPSLQKTHALKALREDPGIQVLIATLKCGGQSLNLTVANRVIIIDQWWNKTAEQQAFGRVVRIGQEKITHLVNIKTKEPIDGQIYSLQKRKARDVDGTLQDDGSQRPQVNELELQKAFLRKKAAEEEKKKQKEAKSKAAKKKAAKASSKKKV